MDYKIFRSKPIINAVLLLFVAVLSGESAARMSGQAQNEFTKAFQAGKKLYEDGEHKEAALNLFQALALTKEKGEIAEVCFYLALTYYALGEKDNCQLHLKKLFEAQPDKDIEAKYFPVGFVGLFYVAKNEAARPAKPAAKAVARGELIPLSEADVEPKLIKSVDPIYPAFGLQLHEERRVTLTILISEDGDVLESKSVQGSAVVKVFEDAAKKAVMKWKYKPAQKGDVPVRVWKQVSFVFRQNRSGNPESRPASRLFF